jgi:Predicted TIM-barrel enzyme, possibly a dioxygenase
MVSRQKIINMLHSKVHRREYILGVIPGSGIAAKSAVTGGADLLAALSSGVFRRMGHSSLAGSLPFANNNKLVIELGAREIIPLVQNKVPIIAGLFAYDPGIDLELYIQNLKRQGFSGVMNYPSIFTYNDSLREALEKNGIDVKKEAEVINIARKNDMFTIAIVTSEQQAMTMASVGADMICVDLGLTVGGQVGAKHVLSLKTAAEMISQVDVALEGMDVFKVFLGGPAKTPIDVKYIFDNTKTMGFLAGSPVDRLPYEQAIVNATTQFKEINLSEQDKLLSEMLDGIHKYYDYVDFVKQYVESNYMNDVTFSEITSIAHLSRSYLSTLFRKEVGCSFVEYLVQTRINKAHQLIESTKMPLQEVAERVGYNDYAHFSKIFKKYTGKTPSCLRSSDVEANCCQEKEVN